MRWALNGSVAMNGREREGWEGVEGLQEGSKGLSYTDEWALASNHRVPSLSNESEDATRKESTCKLTFTKRKGYRKYYSTSRLENIEQVPSESDQQQSNHPAHNMIQFSGMKNHNVLSMLSACIIRREIPPPRDSLSIMLF